MRSVVSGTLQFDTLFHVMLQHRTIRYFSACCLQMRADFKFFLVVIAVFFGSNSQRINIDIPSCPSVFIPKRLWFFRRFYWQNVFPRWPPFQFPDQRVKGIMRTSEEIDFRFRLKLKITLVESTYPSQRPECPSLSPHFLLALPITKQRLIVNGLTLGQISTILT